MKVRDVMTEDVLTIGPEAPLKDVAAILVEHCISGLPVCDAERHVLGVISEADILYQEHDPKETGVKGPLAWLAVGATPHEALVKASARTARRAMTTPPITIRPWCSVAEAARLMSERRVNRLPVVQDDGELVGIVTRADLVRAFARGDHEIERELRDDVLEGTLWLDPGTVELTVKRGTVELSGKLQTRSDVRLLERLAARTPGVTAIDSKLAWDVDDTRIRRSLERARG